MGPIIACYVIGYSGDVGRFRDRDQFAAYNGTACRHPRACLHRVPRGNRRLNHAIAPRRRLPDPPAHSDGRAYFDRKIAEGKTKKEALRSLKRHVSNAVYRRLLVDADRHGR